MEHRPLGRTGVAVSKLCLGAMMFGDWGNKDHDESIRIIHRALDAGINFIDTATFTGRGIRGDRRRGPVRRPAPRRRARHLASVGRREDSERGKAGAAEVGGRVVLLASCGTVARRAPARSMSSRSCPMNGSAPLERAPRVVVAVEGGDLPRGQPSAR